MNISGGAIAAFVDGNHMAGALAPMVIFVGNASIFSNRIIQIAREENTDITFSRFDRMDQLEKLFLDTTTLPKLVVVQDSLCHDLLKDKDRIRRIARKTRFGIAYRDAASARSIIRELVEADLIEGVRFLPMDVHVDVWASVVRLLVSGDNYVPNDLLPALFPKPNSDIPPVSEDDGAALPPKSNILGLTKREIEVLSLVSQGAPNKTIADQLGLSTHTVKLHIHHIISKIGVKNRTGAATWYLSDRWTGAKIGGDGWGK